MRKNNKADENISDVVVEAGDLQEAQALAAKRLAKYVELLDDMAKSKADEVVGMLREERKRQGLTQMQISELTGIATPNVARMEKCKNTPSFQMLNRYAEALGMTLEVTVCRKNRE